MNNQPPPELTNEQKQEAHRIRLEYAIHGTGHAAISLVAPGTMLGIANAHVAQLHTSIDRSYQVQDLQDLLDAKEQELLAQGYTVMNNPDKFQQATNAATYAYNQQQRNIQERKDLLEGIHGNPITANATQRERDLFGQLAKRDPARGYQRDGSLRRDVGFYKSRYEISKYDRNNNITAIATHPRPSSAELFNQVRLINLMADSQNAYRGRQVNFNAAVTELAQTTDGDLFEKETLVATEDQAPITAKTWRDPNNPGQLRPMTWDEVEKAKKDRGEIEAMRVVYQNIINSPEYTDATHAGHNEKVEEAKKKLKEIEDKIVAFFKEFGGIPPAQLDNQIYNHRDKLPEKEKLMPLTELVDKLVNLSKDKYEAVKILAAHNHNSQQNAVNNSFGSMLTGNPANAGATLPPHLDHLKDDKGNIDAEILSLVNEIKRHRQDNHDHSPIAAADARLANMNNPKDTLKRRWGQMKLMYDNMNYHESKIGSKGYEEGEYKYGKRQGLIKTVSAMALHLVGVKTRFSETMTKKEYYADEARRMRESKSGVHTDIYSPSLDQIIDMSFGELGDIGTLINMREAAQESEDKVNKKGKVVRKGKPVINQGFHKDIRADSYEGKKVHAEALSGAVKYESLPRQHGHHEAHDILHNLDLDNPRLVALLSTAFDGSTDYTDRSANFSNINGKTVRDRFENLRKSVDISKVETGYTHAISELDRVLKIGRDEPQTGDNDSKSLKKYSELWQKFLDRNHGSPGRAIQDILQVQENLREALKKIESDSKKASKDWQSRRDKLTNIFNEQEISMNGRRAFFTFNTVKRSDVESNYTHEWGMLPNGTMTNLRVSEIALAHQRTQQEFVAVTVHTYNSDGTAIETERIVGYIDPRTASLVKPESFSRPQQSRPEHMNTNAIDQDMQNMLYAA